MFGFLPRQPTVFQQQYRVYPISRSGKSVIANSDKILLPQSALILLAQLNITYPMMFEISNPQFQRKTHCGVLEFSAEEGICYVPDWILANIRSQPGTMVVVKNVTLPKGTYVKLQPHSVSFTNLSNPKIVLEKALRNFSCLTEGSTVALTHGASH
jgi:ubiquitin fusion degradation protein 1